jgi:hypothetical protein
MNANVPSAPKITLTIYGSEKRLTAQHQRVHPNYFVRIKRSNEGPDFALAEARPMEGETVLNSVEIEDVSTGRAL